MNTETAKLTRAFEAKIDDVSAPRRTVTAKINTNCVDRYSTVIVPRGGDWSNFMRAGPAVLWEHGNDPNRGRLPVAHCDSIRYRKADDDLLSVMRFKGDEFSSQVMEMYADGTLKSFSVEFLPTKSGKPTQEEVRANPTWSQAHTIYRAWELTGFSAVSYPGNPEALAVAVARGLWVPAETRALLDIREGTIVRQDRAGASVPIEEIRYPYLLGEENRWAVCYSEHGRLEYYMSEEHAWRAYETIFGLNRPAPIEESIILDVDNGDDIFQPEVRSKSNDEDEDEDDYDRSKLKQVGDEWAVVSDEGEVIAKHKTKSEAVQQLKAIYVHKAKEGKKSAPDFALILDRLDSLDAQMRAMSEGQGSSGGYATKKKKDKDEGEKPGDPENDKEPDDDEDDDDLVKRYITHEDGEYVVHAEDGKVLGKHKSKADAVAQLQAIEISKHKKSAPESVESAPLPVVQTFNLDELRRRIIESTLPMARTMYFALRARNAQDLEELARGKV